VPHGADDAPQHVAGLLRPLGEGVLHRDEQRDHQDREEQAEEEPGSLEDELDHEELRLWEGGTEPYTIAKK
jgi:hypothetical protein